MFIDVIASECLLYVILYVNKLYLALTADSIGHRRVVIIKLSNRFQLFYIVRHLIPKDPLRFLSTLVYNSLPLTFSPQLQ